MNLDYLTSLPFEQACFIIMGYYAWGCATLIGALVVISTKRKP